MADNDFSDLADFHKWVMETYSIDTSSIDFNKIGPCPVCGDWAVAVEEKPGYYIKFLDEVLDYEGLVYKCPSCDFEADEDNWFDHFQHGLPDWM